jgi:hypothetical protein
MTDTRPKAITRDDLHHIHNELSPILERIEILLEICFDAESDERKTSVLHAVLESEVAQLRSRLDDVCSTDSRHEVQP